MKTTENSSGALGIDDSKNIFSIIAFKYLPYWPIFVLTILISLTVCWFYLRYETPIYKANASIVLKEDKPTDKTDALELLGLSSNSEKNLENEFEVLKSHTLMRKVVTDMGLYAQVYIKGNVRDILAYPYSPVVFISLNPELIQSRTIPFKYLPAEDAVLLAGKKYPLEVPVNTPYGIFRINKNKDIQFSSEKGKKENEGLYLQLTPVNSLAKDIDKRLIVEAKSKNSSVISLTITDQSAKRAENILNNLIRVYNKAGIDDKNTTAANTLSFIRDRLAIVNSDLSKVEDQIQSYKSKEGIVDLSEQGKLYLGSVQSTDQKLAETQIQLSVLDQIEKYVIKKGDKPGTVPATLSVSDPLLLELLQKLYEAELDLDKIRGTAGENSPSVKALQSDIDRIKPGILENLNSLRKSLLVTEKSLEAQGNRNSEVLKAVPYRERELLAINRKQIIENTIYTFLLQKQEETTLSVASAVAESRLVDEAESSTFPVSPIKVNIYLLGLFIGVFVGAVIVLTKEQYNRSVLFRTDIENQTNAPILGEIVHNPTGETFAIKDGKRTIIAEQFRSIRTSLNYLGINKDRKVILLTSSFSGEGKSFIAINLAVTLTLADKKVVLLEFDLRKPKIIQMLNIPLKKGLSEYMADLAGVDEIVQEVSEIPQLFIISSGAIPPNPTELIMNGKIDILMEYLKKNFDYIIIDSPPIGLVTDAKLLSHYANTCLYIIRHGYTPKAYLKMINNLYVSGDLTNMNLIFNGLKPRGVTYGYGQGYGYGQQGYGYGYGYGYTEDDNNTQPNFFGRIFKRNKKE